MRKYTSEHIGKILKKKSKEMELLVLVGKYQKLKEIWAKIPDPTLQKLEPEFLITKEGKLIIQCPSSVQLNYLRRQGTLIQRHLEVFMAEEAITSLEIALFSSKPKK